MAAHADGSDGALALWHAVRFPVLFAVAALLLLYRLYGSLKSLQAQETAHVADRTKTTLPGLSERKLGLSDHASAATKPSPLPTTGTRPPVRKSSPKRVTGGNIRAKKSELNRKRSGADAASAPDIDTGFDHIQPVIFYASLTTTTSQLAETLQSLLFTGALPSAYPSYSISTTPSAPPALPRMILPVQLLDLEKAELDDYFVVLPAPSHSKTKYLYFVLLPTYDPPEQSPSYAFLQHLQETHHDFRIDTAPLRNLGGFSVFGVGDSSEWGDDKHFCRDAKQADKWLGKLTGGTAGGNGRRIFPIGFADANPESEGKGDVEAQLRNWATHLEEAVREYALTGELGESQGMRAAVESGDEDSDAAVQDEEEDIEGENVEEMVDVEDLGRIISKGRQQNKVNGNGNQILAVDFTTKGKSSSNGETLKEMVPKGSPTYNALTKQGYTIVGSHSGVKICRWTKSALRGRGSCYKYSFYGIQSHLCMETTPSLSCSNKCVFCWRHGTNPVGTTWRWQVDPPATIFRGVVEGHYKKIKMLKGVPGVRADRFAEAFRIRHCALSLVGEPIFYPHINDFLRMLHAERISSFLVCNAQHPDELERLGPVTQLYVSIDASNKDSLRRIDRPLHRDFWERFQRCMRILREKRKTTRTVFRLTLVKGFNIDAEVPGYADLIATALPCFVEVKGVTYCGTSTSAKSGLSMANVPFYEEVVAFVRALEAELVSRGLDYGLAAEHAHSCCALLGSRRFCKEGKWCTWIDYERFFELVESGRQFGPEDYVGNETPEWAVWGEGGFDPRDERVYRKGKGDAERKGGEEEVVMVVESVKVAA
ncbi:radical SAM superfamily-domain-containing protein [Kalaharituber pfeilii]|nr:radical SAM superfamily-domain-containing protein [Kalaharituber pfeilii]